MHHPPPSPSTVVVPHSLAQFPVTATRPMIHANGYGDSPGSFDAVPRVTPTSAYFSTMSSMGGSSSKTSPTTMTVQEHSLAPLPEPNAPLQHTHPSCNTNSPNAGFSPLLSSSHPPSPRNSFLSFRIPIYSLPLQHPPSHHSLRRRPLLNRHHIYLASVDWGLSLRVLVGSSRVRDRV